MGWVGSYNNLNDLDADGVFDAVGNLYANLPPETKKYYLKAGQISCLVLMQATIKVVQR
jgi:hypothetical protein